MHSKLHCICIYIYIFICVYLNHCLSPMKEEEKSSFRQSRPCGNWLVFRTSCIQRCYCTPSLSCTALVCILQWPMERCVYVCIVYVYVLQYIQYIYYYYIYRKFCILLTTICIWGTTVIVYTAIHYIYIYMYIMLATLSLFNVTCYWNGLHTSCQVGGDA